MTEFDYNPDVASSIYSVQQALGGDVYKTIDVTVKVVNKENNKQPIVSKGKQLMKTECGIADHTNTIALTLWEDLIDVVDCGKTYKFKNVKIRSFNDIKYLTTNEGTTIHQDIYDINMDFEDISLSLNISEGKCISAKLKRELFCIACNACIKGIASDGMITCQNCQMTTLEENCSHKLVAQLLILTAKGKVQSYTCFNDALQSFLASNNTNLTIDTTDLDELKKLLLTSPAKQMIIDDSTKSITQFLLYLNYKRKTTLHLKYILNIIKLELSKFK
ncbi:uncharacterized protein [Acropora muricata]|uniref:uncharacterized protein n=1 Tax=Acropora muricata TaxID=159855 RepID=UPI0034E3C70E